MIWARVKVVSCLNVALISGLGPGGAGRGGEEERRRGPAVAVTRLLAALLPAQ